MVWGWERFIHNQPLLYHVWCTLPLVALCVTFTVPLSTGYFLYLDLALLDFIENASFLEDGLNPPPGNKGQVFVLRFCDVVTFIVRFPKTGQWPCCLHHNSRCRPDPLVDCLRSLAMCVSRLCVYNRPSALVAVPIYPTVLGWVPWRSAWKEDLYASEFYKI